MMFKGKCRRLAATLGLIGAATVAQPVLVHAEKIENPVAVFAGLDKITGRIISFDVYIGETVQFGALQVVPRVCYSRPPTETPQTTAFVEADEITLNNEVRRIFTGWMFASSPGLHAIEHAVYDVWLTDCKQSSSVPPPENYKGPAVTAPAVVDDPLGDAPLPSDQPHNEPRVKPDLPQN